MGLLREYVWKNEYKYYDSPEGQDCFKKLWYVTKYCGVYSLGYSALDVLLYSHPKGYIPTIGRFAYIMCPAVAMGASFVTTVCVATNLRKKDDRLNYFLGGYSMGAILGAWKNSMRIGVYSGFIMAALAVLQKDSIINNYPLLTEHEPHPRIFGTFWTLKMDYSILKDPGRTWKHPYEVEDSK